MISHCPRSKILSSTSMVLWRRINGKSSASMLIGTEGKGVGQYTQKQAIEKRLRIKQWSLITTVTLLITLKRKCYRTTEDIAWCSESVPQEKEGLNQEHDSQGVLLSWEPGSDCIPPQPHWLIWSGHGGRETVMRAIDAIGDGSKYDLANRCQRLLPSL